MKLEERYNLESIKNKTTELIFEKIQELTEERDDFCKCQECISDLAAFILNHVTPMYYTSLLGSLHSDTVQEKKIQVEIDLAINAGLKRIKQHPHHD